MAAKDKERIVYIIKVKGPYILMDDDVCVGEAGSRVTAADTAKQLGYDKVEEVTLEQWLALISS